MHYILLCASKLTYANELKVALLAGTCFAGVLIVFSIYIYLTAQKYELIHHNLLSKHSKISQILKKRWTVCTSWPSCEQVQNKI